jgi:trehalose-6-phosphatase
MKVQESVNADGSSPSDVTSAAITQIAAAGDNVLKVISVRKETLTKRYVGVLVTSGAGTNGSNDAVLAQAYRKSGSTPVTQAEAGANHYGTTERVKV